MITNGWVDWAKRVYGISDKVWSPNRAKKFLVNHSIEGNLGTSLVPPRFLSRERDGSGNYTASAQASVHFVLHKDGTLIQMYPLEASPWTSGSKKANEDGVAIETEGVAGELLNPAQVATYVQLVRELEGWFGFPLSRAAGTIKEHHELAQTACPSGRYQSAYDALAKGETAMTTAERKEFDDLKAQVKALNEAETKRWELVRLAAGTDDAGYQAMLDANAAVRR